MNSSVIIEIAFLSCKVAVVATVLVMPFAVALGWWFAKKDFPGKPLVETIVMLPMFLPPVATGLFLLTLLSTRGPLGWFWGLFGSGGLLLTWQAEVFAAGVIGLPFFVKSCQQAFADVPWRLEAMGRTLGLSHMRVFLKISLPSAARGVAYGFVLCFARGMGEFGATSLVAGIIPGQTETFALGIYARIIASQDGEAWVLCAVSAVIVGSVLLLAEIWLRPRGGQRP